MTLTTDKKTISGTTTEIDRAGAVKKGDSFSYPATSVLTDPKMRSDALIRAPLLCPAGCLHGFNDHRGNIFIPYQFVEARQISCDDLLQRRQLRIRLRG